MYDSRPFTHAEKKTSCPITGHNHESTINESKLHLGTLLTKKIPTPLKKKTLVCQCGIWLTPHFPRHFSLLHIGALGQPQVPWFLPGWVKNVDHFAAIVLTPRWRHHVWQLQGPFLLGSCVVRFVSKSLSAENNEYICVYIYINNM